MVDLARTIAPFSPPPPPFFFFFFFLPSFRLPPFPPPPFVCFRLLIEFYARPINTAERDSRMHRGALKVSSSGKRNKDTQQKPTEAARNTQREDADAPLASRASFHTSPRARSFSDPPKMYISFACTTHECPYLRRMQSTDPYEIQGAYEDEPQNPTTQRCCSPPCMHTSLLASTPDVGVRSPLTRPPFRVHSGQTDGHSQTSKRGADALVCAQPVQASAAASS